VLEEFERKEKARGGKELSSVLDAADWGNIPAELQEQVLESLKGQEE
jgi:hypothetical protein